MKDERDPGALNPRILRARENIARCQAFKAAAVPALPPIAPPRLEAQLHMLKPVPLTVSIDSLLPE